MKKFEFVGKLLSYDRLHCSVNGNPAFSATFVNAEGETLTGRTTSDASCAYGFLNYQYAPRKITYHITRGGKNHFDYVEVIR